MSQSLVLEGLRPVFVVGHPRSGTTLVQLLLTAHPRFWSAPETHLFSHVLEIAPAWQSRVLQADELPAIFTRLSQKPGIVLKDNVQSAIIAQAKTDGGISPAALLNAIMRQFTDHPEGSRWLEKTPRHALHIPDLLRMFPDARIINIVRDPRDVASSPIRFEDTPHNSKRSYMHVELAERWKDLITFTKNFASEPRVMTIRYEDIIENPKLSLERMMSFVNEKADVDVALTTFSSNYTNVTVSKEDVWKQLCSAGEIVDRRMIYKKRMTPQEAQLVETITGDLMREYGYQPEHPPSPWRVTTVRLQHDVPQAIRRGRALVYEKTRRSVGKALRAVGLMPKR